MRTRENAVGPLLALCVLSVLLVGLVAGCGGGDQQQGGGEKEQQDGGRAANVGESETKIALGTVRAVKPDKGRISLKPTVERQGDGSLAFKVGENADITLDGRKAEIADVKGGQQAQIEYVGGEKGVGRATSVQLFGVRRQPSGGDENTN
jgi:hypothetical protein